MADTNALDPEADSTTSVDASKPGFQKAWNEWTSKPENNAALLQFGIAMLQPRAPGQTSLGAAANAVGEAGGAVGRVTAAQRAEDQQAASEEDKKSLRESQRMNAEGSLLANQAYARNLDAGGGRGSSKNPSLTRELNIQKAFGAWLQKEDFGTDPTVKAIGATDKAQIQNDPALRQKAFRKFRENFLMSEDEGGTPDPTLGVTPSSPPAANMPQDRMFKGRVITLDPTQRHWIFKDDGSPAQ